MKKLSFLLLAGLFLISCDNEDVSKNSISETSKAAYPGYTTLHTDSEEWSCHGAPTDCAPEIVVCGNCRTSENSLIIELLSKNNSNLRSFIIENRERLKDVLHPSTINQLNSENVSVTIHKNVSEKRDFILFKRGNKVIDAYPFSIE